jgi:hypothetical protein
MRNDAMTTRRKIRRPLRPSSLLQNRFDLVFGPALAERSHADARSVVGIDQRVRGDVVVDLEQPQLGGRQPRQRVVDISRENLPGRAVVQFDEMALGMLRDFHGVVTRLYLAASPGCFIWLFRLSQAFDPVIGIAPAC